MCYRPLRGALACLIVLAGLASLGRLMARASHFHPIHILTGWALTAIALTVAATLTGHALLTTMLALFILMAWSFIPALRQGYFETPFWIVMLVPGLLILTVINLSGIARWDDFSHWVPNALFLFQHNSLPSAVLPATHSVWPGYPYALPFLTYLASQLASGFILQGGAMFNVLLLLMFAGLLAETGSVTSSRLKFGLMAVAMIVVTLAQPGL